MKSEGNGKEDGAANKRTPSTKPSILSNPTLSAMLILKDGSTRRITVAGGEHIEIKNEEDEE